MASRDNIANSAIAGIGTDLAEVSRVRAMLEKYGAAFIEKTFTDAEIAYCSKKAAPEIHYAARFAAKEAVVKALGTGFTGKIGLKSVSVENDSLGAPVAVLDENVRELMLSMGGKKVLVSLTHTKECASAFAVISR